MLKGPGDTREPVGRGDTVTMWGLPIPTMQFRRRAWLAFQQALDPLAPPKPLPTWRRR
jgi:hypothetical protein